MPRSDTPMPGRPVRGSATGRPVMALLDLLGRRWALRVLWELRSGPVPGFRELQSRCGGVSSSVLSDRLAELREAGIVERGRDGYRLSARGAELAEAIMLMARWAADWPGEPEGTAGAGPQRCSPHAPAVRRPAAPGPDQVTTTAMSHRGGPDRGNATSPWLRRAPPGGRRGSGG